ncbi:hypothetical protein [Sphingobium yanoikuyae]|jgi:hypothetical protein|uniref:hypothetical protein n=1 Tax=Sphingobium yanoikuyae TaxID=13690 RepID=UPI0035C8114B
MITMIVPVASLKEQARSFAEQSAMTSRAIRMQVEQQFAAQEQANADPTLLPISDYISFLIHGDPKWLTENGIEIAREFHGFSNFIRFNTPEEAATFRLCWGGR